MAKQLSQQSTQTHLFENNSSSSINLFFLEYNISYQRMVILKQQLFQI